MYHQTAQKLAHMTDHVEFERMMCDLLSSIGYAGIDPQSPGLQDNGKDALYYAKGTTVLFAFSIRKDWKIKFLDDFRNASESDISFTKFVFCTNQSIPTLEKDKLRKGKAVDIDFFDLERIRVLLDTHCKKIREIYLGIQDNTTIRRKIQNVLFDPQNEVTYPERWQMLALVTPLDMIGLFGLIKDEDLTLVCETQEEHDALTSFTHIFRKFRKLATDIDNYIFSVIGNSIDNNYTPYWQKIGEYCKSRLLCAEGKISAEKRISTWNVQSGYADCEKVYEILLIDQQIKEFDRQLTAIYEQLVEIRSTIHALNGFSVDY